MNQEWEAYLYEQGEVNEEVKELRMAAGLTQQELSVATGIEIEHIAAEERGEGGLSAGYWRCIYGVCNDRIKMFKRDAGLTIKLG
jgi:DNA-binding XRE family transcriptional regulator